MSLTDQLNAPPPTPIHGAPCSVGVLRDELPVEECAALDKMLYDLDWSARQVETAVTAEGHYIAYTSIGKHRREQCRCFVVRP